MKYTKNLMLKNPAECNKLVNMHIHRLMRLKSFRYSNKIYFKPPFFHEKTNQLEKVEVPSYSGRTRTIVKPVYKLDDPNELYYVEHYGIKISSKIMWDELFLVLTPTRHFTHDGYHAIDNDFKKHLITKYLTPVYNRSDTYRQWTIFWKHFLFDDEMYNNNIMKWYRNFKFHDFEKIIIRGVPKSLDIEQRILLEFPGVETND